jgi:putative addiction module antidote
MEVPGFLLPTARSLRYNERMNVPFKLLSLKLVKIGNSTGVVLPKELLARLGVQAGDTLNASSDGDGILIKPSDDAFETQMAAAREVMERRKRALRELAK